MKNVTNLDSAFHQIIQSSPLDSALGKTAYKILAQNIPSEVIRSGVFCFGRSYTLDEKLSLEISILTKDCFFYDLSGNSSNLTLTRFAYTLETDVTLKTFYSDSTHAENDNFPYRVELDISSGIKGIGYKAEGDRRVISALMNYASQCYEFLHKGANINE